MGVPSFFRWLSQKYPKIIVDVVEEEPKTVDDVEVPVDTSGPNPNNIEFDNLYLDMNGIIHPCSHPEDRPAPNSEEEIMIEIMRYIDRLFAMVRPRKLLFMAIDGVAPRAKMNQQRTRRFRAAQEAREKALLEEQVRKDREALGEKVEAKPEKAFKFDSNCITPGTSFMHKVSQALEYYVVDKTNTDPGWRNVKVILSDANVPGEGEHKIMEFIRRQRLQPDYDANLKHVIYGLDADLIMLTLATHEAHFTILRELVTFGNAGTCYTCGQAGHLAVNCTMKAKERQGEHDQLSAVKKPFQYLHIFVLREYLALDLKPAAELSFEWDFERAVDDFVLLCFFVGNDFLPHLPTLEIREGAIELLMNIYSRTLPKLDGYLTHNGEVNLERVEHLVLEIGGLENTILEQRRAKMLRDQQRRDREKQYQTRRQSSDIKELFTSIGASDSVGVPELTRSGSGGGSRASVPAPAAARPPPPKSNHEAADIFRAALLDDRVPGERAPAPAASGASSSSTPGLTRSASDAEEDDDDVKLGELGWKERYYKSKFQIESDADRERFCQEISRKYAEGLCWVMRYYYQGCCSWRWYYPYHYAPFSGDMLGIGKMKLQFELGTPFKPIEQLMCVLPTASKQFLPVACQKLMEDPQSELFKYYPTEFKIDRNGKKMAWQGVALLPFIDEGEFFAAVKDVEATLTEEEAFRNRLGDELLFVNVAHRLNSFLQHHLYNHPDYDSRTIQINPELSDRLFGEVRGKAGMLRYWKNGYPSPLSIRPPVEQNHTLLAAYFNPRVAPGTVFEARLLPNAEVPPAVLLETDRQHRPPTVHDNDAVSRLVRRSVGEGGHGPMREREGPAPRFHPYAHDRGGRQDPRVDDRFNRPNDQHGEKRHHPSFSEHGGEESRHDQRSDHQGYAGRHDGGYRGGGGGYGGGRGGGERGGYHGRGDSGGFDRGGYRGGSDRGGYRGGGGGGGHRGGFDRGGHHGGGFDRGGHQGGGGFDRGGHHHGGHRGGGGGSHYQQGGGHQQAYHPPPPPVTAPPQFNYSVPVPSPSAPADAARLLSQMMRPEQLQALLPVAQLQQLAQQQQQHQQHSPAQFQQPPPHVPYPPHTQHHQQPYDPRMKRGKH